MEVSEVLKRWCEVELNNYKKDLLHIIVLKDGEKLLCRNYYISTNNNEYRIEVLYSSNGEYNFDYDVLKDEIESITTYTNCYIKDISGHNFMNISDSKSIEVFIEKEQ